MYLLSFYDLFLFLSIFSDPFMFWLFCSLLCTQRVHFIISCRDGFVLMNFFSFVRLGETLYLFLFWMIALLDRVFLAAHFSLSALWIYHATAFWPAKFLLKKSADSHMGFTWCVTVFSLVAFNIVYHWDAWVAQLAKHLILNQVRVSGSRDQARLRVWLSLSLSPGSRALTLSLK